MKYFFLFLLCFSISMAAISQAFSIQAKPTTQTIEAFTEMMDQGAHAIHLEVGTDENNELIVSPAILLSNAIKALEWHTKSYTRFEIEYVIELRTSANYLQESKAVHDLLDQYISLERVVVQSENLKILKYWKKHYPQLKLCLFINNKKSVATNLVNLGFIPTAYSSNYALLTPKSVSDLHQKSIEVIPWMVNDITTMQRLIDWKVDGFVTNSPDQSKLLGINGEIKTEGDFD